MSRQRFVNCSWCDKRTATDAPGVDFTPAYHCHTEESDEWIEDRLTCAQCLKENAAFADDEAERLEETYAEQAERDEEWERIGQWAEAHGL